MKPLRDTLPTFQPPAYFIQVQGYWRRVWTIDKDQMIWKMDTSLVRISIVTGEAWHYACADPRQLEALRTATCLQVDSQGILWVGTGGYGILKYDAEKERFHHILPGTIHYQILELKPGELITNNRIL